MRALGPPLNKKRSLSIMYEVLLYKQFIRPMKDNACPIRSFGDRVEILQVLQSKCFCLATVASWYVSSRQIHEDLGVPFFANIRNLTASFDSKLTDVRKLLVRQLVRYLRWSRVDPCSLTPMPRANAFNRTVEATEKRSQVDWTHHARRCSAGYLSNTLTDVVPCFSSV
jgi:hypothetical protein